MSLPDTATIREAVASWLKIIGSAVAIGMVVVSITMTFNRLGERVTVLETRADQQEAVDEQQGASISTNSGRIFSIEKWAPTVDLKLDLLLQHFGIRVPTS